MLDKDVFHGRWKASAQGRDGRSAPLVPMPEFPAARAAAFCFATKADKKGERNLTNHPIGKRLCQIVIVLFGISFLTFGLTYISPGDPAEIMLTECGNVPHR